MIVKVKERRGGYVVSVECNLRSGMKLQQRQVD